MNVIKSRFIAGAIFLGGCMTPLPVAEKSIDQASILGQWDLERVDRHPMANAISLEFRADGQVRGAIECNTFLTDYQISGQKIEFGTAIITAAGCHPRFDAEPQLVEQAESALFAVPPARISEDGDTLILRGSSVLVFRRVR